MMSDSNSQSDDGFRAFFVVGRDQRIRSRHETAEEAWEAANDRPRDPDSFEELEGWTMAYEIVYRGLVPEVGKTVPLGWLRACTRPAFTEETSIILDDLWAFVDSDDYGYVRDVRLGGMTYSEYENKEDDTEH